MTCWAMDETMKNDIPLFRYAELLLNYAEAKAELGTLTDSEWSETIGTLRRRAGITGGDLDQLPTVVDSYLQQTYFPRISNPVLLEIRRERGVELCLEGVRLTDLKRWACGELWQNTEWTGIYVPALETPIDVNEDGIYDLYLTDNKDYKGEYAKIMVLMDNVQTVKQLSDDPNHGYVYNYALNTRVWNENMYLYPVPQEVRNLNTNLTQNPGW